MKFKTSTLLGCALAFLLVNAAVVLADPGAGGSLESQFAHPPDSARPWVYWFWLNGNVTREGITADLESMKRVGIGGVLIMEVDQGTPKGPIAFASPQWRELFKFVCSEAKRLGMQVNMTNDAGWCGSGGPWITPELSMQKVVWTQAHVEGGHHVDQVLAQPEKVAGYYEDICVLAFPTPSGKYVIHDIKEKSSLEFNPYFPYNISPPAPSSYATVPANKAVTFDKIIDLTASCKNGRLSWDVPPGKWTVLRLGHTSTGTKNHPAPASGLGLECDKLSTQAMDAMFAGLMGKLIADNKPLVGKTLVRTHIDSWEVGTQNWTPLMLAEFKQRRGYDALRFLPALTGSVVDTLEKSERFLWDWRQTISELLSENYAGHFEALAKKNGIELSIEAYAGGPFDEIRYGGRADEPMGEFWSWNYGGASETVTEMTSAAHVYGKPIVGAESFTALGSEAWRGYPGSHLKGLGDWAFCEGVNRFVIHRYAMQPWRDYKPGMSMGPWGLHYERTQTWWEQSKPWHEYLARCQSMLRRGLFVADICYLQPEGAPRQFRVPIKEPGNPPDRPGYNFDGCSPEVVLTRMSVKDGRIVLPDGMSYRLLALPDARTMTPQLLSRIKELVAAGAVVVGPPPEKSPSLENYPACDKQVKQLAGELWGDCDGKTITEHRLGLGRVVWGKSPEKVLADMGIAKDFSCDENLRGKLDFTHRHCDDGTDLYFVANRKDYPVEGVCRFRVTGKEARFFRPETGANAPAASYWESGGVTCVPIYFTADESVFVVFKGGVQNSDPVVSMVCDGRTLLPRPVTQPAPGAVSLAIRSALYGPPGDKARTRDVTALVRQIVGNGETEFPVVRAAEAGDPTPGIVKTLTVTYTVNGQSRQARGTDYDILSLQELSPVTPPDALASIDATPDGNLTLHAWKNGAYEVRTQSGKNYQSKVSDLPSAVELSGPWTLRFPPRSGAPDQVTLDKLTPWDSNHTPGVRYFSGTATYHKAFYLSPRQFVDRCPIDLDLGQVAVIARVKVNGHDLGILWKTPYRVEITQAVKPGDNDLEIQVTNLWINRMIGDEFLPEDSQRNNKGPSGIWGNRGTLKIWPQWVQEGKPSPTGRFTFTTWRLWNKNSPLQESGLVGPVTLRWSRRITLR